MRRLATNHLEKFWMEARRRFLLIRIDGQSLRSTIYDQRSAMGDKR